MIEVMTYEKAREVMTFDDSYSRLDTLCRLYLKMQQREWLKLLGEEWSGCDNINTYRRFLKGVAGTAGPIPEMMNDEEIAAYNELPDVLTVYRGCGSKNMTGASWTTDRAVAEEFPFMNRYLTKEPLLVTGKVKKKNVLAYKLDRNESEIITFSARRVSVESIAVPAKAAEYWGADYFKMAA